MLYIFFNFIYSKEISFNFTQKINHLNMFNDIYFNQQYIINNNFTNNSSNYIILQISGKEIIDINKINYCEEILLLSKYLSCDIITLEHRFFGKSLPNNLSKIDIINYLNINNILGDISNFISQKISKNFKIILFGLNYGGTLASWFRLKYPHLSEFSIVINSPSTNTFTSNNFDLNYFNYFNNSNKIIFKNFFNEINNIIFNGTSLQIENLLNEFNFSNFYNTNSFLIILFEIFYKYKNIINFNNNNFSIFFKNIINNYSENINFYDALINLHSTWLSCTEIGFFKTSNDNFLSNNFNYSFYRNLCLNLFNLSFINKNKINNSFITNSIFINYLNNPFYNYSILLNNTSLMRYSFNINLFEFNLIFKFIKKNFLKNNFQCFNGKKKFNKCICFNGFEGINCLEKSMPYNLFHIFNIFTVLLPTLIFIFYSFYVWNLVEKTDNEYLLN